MPHLLLDLIAVPPSFQAGTFTAATPTILYNTVRAILLAAGWIETSTDMWLSLQSPWHDHDGTPAAGYIGKVKFKATFGNDGLHGQIFNFNQSQFSLPLGLPNPTVLVYSAGATYKYNACPFQVMFKNINNNSNFIVSNLHTPNFEQEAGLVDAFVMMYNFDSMKHNGDFGWVYTKNAAGEYSHNAKPSVSGRLCFSLYRNRASTEPVGLYNLADDPTMADPYVWFPFISPPVINFADTIGNCRSRGWLWNCINVGKGYVPEKILNIGSQVFEGFTDNNIGGTGEPAGTLFFRNS